MRRLVVVGRWDAIAADVAPLATREVRSFQDSIRRDGIRKVRDTGVLRHDCPVSPSVGAGHDCFVYQLEGRKVVPFDVVMLRARYRLWLGYEDGKWQVLTYDYDLKTSR
jgi:hypothetical protein